MKKLLTLLTVLAICSCTPALATSLSGNLTVDNGFTAFLSTNDYQLGTELKAGTSWQTSYSFNVDLTPGETYYLHIFAYNSFNNNDTPNTSINPGAFLGDFSLSDAGFRFANGTTRLLTTAESDFWRVGTLPYQTTPDNWTNNYDSEVAAFGANLSTTKPWNRAISDISSDAQWIWTGDEAYTPRYFSTTIQAVPEASSIMLALCGLGTMGGFRGIVRRFKK